jgi:CHASE2 domain-containing sensor protein
MKMFQITVFVVMVVLSCNSQEISYSTDEIILINTDNLDREGIAKEIAIINSLNPKVVAIDLFFVGSTKYSKDWSLFKELSECKSLVMASMIGDYTGTDSQYKRFVEESEPQFLINAKTGFTNAILENDEYETLKRFSIKEIVSGEIEYHFSILTVMLYDSLKAINFVKSNHRIVEVDYKDGQRKFKKFSANEVLNNEVKLADIEGKIVMMGFLGPGNDDKFNTPLNKNPEEPDMYGLEYLANIVAQVLEFE